MSKDPNYPAMKWQPITGEARTFTAPEDVPEGWLDTHPLNLPPKPAPLTVAEAAEVLRASTRPAPDSNAGELPMTRDEIKVALDQLQVQYAKNAGDAKLYVLLGEAVREDLTAAAIEFDPHANTATLLALLPEPPVAE